VLPNSVEGLAVLDAGLARLGPAAVLQERALELEIQLGRTDAALDLLLALLSASRMTNAANQTADITNSYFIMTSNLGARKRWRCARAAVFL